jgi:hypothetical protein
MEATGSSETLVHSYTQKMVTAGLSENLTRNVLEKEAAGSSETLVYSSNLKMEATVSSEMLVHSSTLKILAACFSKSRTISLRIVAS